MQRLGTVFDLYRNTDSQVCESCYDKADPRDTIVYRDRDGCTWGICWVCEAEGKAK